ncbi:hypothetical protein F2Q69_00044772 [Brassica cretica]|uniref:Uncharacterized protein n=1 Tax=Brassica cretica TaxID=69181 RepID=A0A8S9NEC5_BRACR|nr:hypothetical protein F2Q69_00044772 [Brassica cretica]
MLSICRWISCWRSLDRKEGKLIKKLTSRVETTNVATRSLKDSVSSTDLEREVDHLMRHEYPSPVNPKKRSPVHN